MVRARVPFSRAHAHSTRTFRPAAALLLLHNMPSSRSRPTAPQGWGPARRDSEALVAELHNMNDEQVLSLRHLLNLLVRFACDGVEDAYVGACARPPRDFVTGVLDMDTLAALPPRVCACVDAFVRRVEGSNASSVGYELMRAYVAEECRAAEQMRLTYAVSVLVTGRAGASDVNDAPQGAASHAAAASSGRSASSTSHEPLWAASTHLAPSTRTPAVADASLSRTAASAAVPPQRGNTMRTAAHPGTSLLRGTSRAMSNGHSLSGFTMYSAASLPDPATVYQRAVTAVDAELDATVPEELLSSARTAGASTGEHVGTTQQQGRLLPGLSGTSLDVSMIASASPHLPTHNGAPGSGIEHATSYDTLSRSLSGADTHPFAGFHSHHVHWGQNAHLLSLQRSLNRMSASSIGHDALMVDAAGLDAGTHAEPTRAASIASDCLMLGQLTGQAPGILNPTSMSMYSSSSSSALRSRLSHKSSSSSQLMMPVAQVSPGALRRAPPRGKELQRQASIGAHVLHERTRSSSSIEDVFAAPALTASVSATGQIDKRLQEHHVNHALTTMADAVDALDAAAAAVPSRRHPRKRARLVDAAAVVETTDDDAGESHDDGDDSDASFEDEHEDSKACELSSYPKRRHANMTRQASTTAVAGVESSAAPASPTAANGRRGKLAAAVAARDSDTSSQSKETSETRPAHGAVGRAHVHTGQDGVRRYFCRFKCGKSYRHRGTLRDHEANVHNNKVYVCETCHTTFTASSNLKRHRRQQHPNERGAAVTALLVSRGDATDGPQSAPAARAGTAAGLPPATETAGLPTAASALLRRTRSVATAAGAVTAASAAYHCENAAQPVTAQPAEPPAGEGLGTRRRVDVGGGGGKAT